MPKMRISHPGQRSSSSRRTISVWTCGRNRAGQLLRRTRKASMARPRSTRGPHRTASARRPREALARDRTGRTMASFELRVPRVKTSPAYGCWASSGVRVGRLCARRLMGHAGGGTVGNDWDDVVGIGGWSGGRDEIMAAGWGSHAGERERTRARRGELPEIEGEAGGARGGAQWVRLSRWTRS